MRKIAIAAAVSLSLSCVTNVSHALGLGEIEMYSALNQTLDAEIAILSATDAELRDMNVSLASAGAFARAGLVQSPVLSSVDFAVDRRPDGKAVIKVTSDSPVLEPFLNFLLEVDAPGSVKLVREFTVLLNPSTFAGGQSGNSGSDQSGNGQLLTAAGSSDVFANSASDGTGVEIDISEASLSGSSESNGSFAGNDNTNELPIAETFADSDSNTDTLFVPAGEVLNDNVTGRTLTDNDGQVISLEQNTPQFDNSSLANASAQGGDSGNAIFTSEFDGDGELISAEELRGLISDATPAASSGDFQGSGGQFVADLSSTDTDAQGGVGDLLDLSGLLDDSGPAFVEEDQGQSFSSGSSASVELSGSSYQVRSQDTLWSIANVQKAGGVTTHQMVVALVDANPEAFIGGNMNRMINGAVLQIPTENSQRSVDRASAIAIVQSWTRGDTPARSGASSQPSRVFEESEIVVDNSNSSFSTDLNSNLDDVNQRYETVQTEIATGTVERDQLQGRVDNLTDNMEEMKSLITVRENELNQLQDEVQAAESNAAAIDEQISQLSNASNSVAAVQQGLSQDIQGAQNEILKQADADKNMATAEAEAQSLRLSSEEDALRSQLAALQIEKRDLEASSQLDEAALVREAEAEKTRMLAQATAERENIAANLEAEKARISSNAEIEMARVESGAQMDSMASDTEQMQAEEPMELESTAAAQSGESSRVKDRLAQLQQEGGDKAADMKAGMADTMDADAMDTDAMKMDADTDIGGKVGDAVSGISDAGKSMVAGGAAAVGGLLGFAPLQGMVGNRKTVLGAGAGLALLGLLAAWLVRRRKPKGPDVKGMRPRGEGRAVVAPPAHARGNARDNGRRGHARDNGRGNPNAKDQAKIDREEAMYGDVDEKHAKPQQRSGNSAAAAAAAAAAAVTGTAAVAASRGRDKVADSVGQDKPLTPNTAEPKQAAAPNTATESTVQAPEAVTTPGPQATAAAQPTDAKPADAVVEPSTSATAATAATATVAGKTADAESKVDKELDEKALDDTITEAEVYLRYGLHGQAEDLLKTAIERSPNNEEYHFKLLENYHDEKNGDKFNALADKFNSKFPNTRHASRVAEMGAEIASGNTGFGNTVSDNTASDHTASDHTASGNTGIGNDNGEGEATGNKFGLGGLAAGAAGAAALATGALGGAKDAAAGGLDSLTGSGKDMDTDLLDQTIDPGSEFSVDELQATGNLGAFADSEVDFSDAGELGQSGLDKAGFDKGNMSLDDVDLASLDDDGTMNLEEITGNQMSGGDLGSLDLTNPVDNSFDNLSLEDTDLGGKAGGIAGGLAGGVAGIAAGSVAGGAGSIGKDLPINNPAEGGSDEMETMLDLAKAYIDMGDSDNASKALKDIATRGNPMQQAEASELLKKLS